MVTCRTLKEIHFHIWLKIQINCCIGIIKCSICQIKFVALVRLLLSEIFRISIGTDVAIACILNNRILQNTNLSEFVTNREFIRFGSFKSCIDHYIVSTKLGNWIESVTTNWRKTSMNNSGVCGQSSIYIRCNSCCINSSMSCTTTKNFCINDATWFFIVINQCARDRIVEFGFSDCISLKCEVRTAAQ